MMRSIFQAGMFEINKKSLVQWLAGQCIAETTFLFRVIFSPLQHRLGIVVLVIANLISFVLNSLQNDKETVTCIHIPEIHQVFSLETIQHCS